MKYFDKQITIMAGYTLTINRKKIKIEAEPDMPLLWVIRDVAGLKGTKFGCGMAQCGACTIHLDGQAVRSCQIPVSSLNKKSTVVTIEGLETNGKLHALQEAWIEEQVPQCGYCQSGQIMSALSLLQSNPDPKDEEISSYMSGNLCRCGTYERINRAIKKAAKSIKA